MFKGLIAEPCISGFTRLITVILLLVLLTSCAITGYAQNTKTIVPSPPLAGFLTERQEQLIRSLPNTPKKIPAWLIAELLPCSEQLHRNLTSNNNYLSFIKIITLNQILADSSRYKAKLIAIKAIFGTVKPVSNDLMLTSPDRCWSVISFDAKYLHPIQCFTSQYPSGFRKGRQIYIIGYHITNRWDCQEDNTKILVPVFVGTIMPVFSPVNDVQRHKSFKGFLGLIAILILLYLVVRIYIAKSSDTKDNLVKHKFIKRK